MKWEEWEEWLRISMAPILPIAPTSRFYGVPPYAAFRRQSIQSAHTTAGNTTAGSERMS